ncbi:MAG TPA: cupin domain-containing protein [Caldilineaceae bacterium]|nr:cupin domain-containing protein [Caldilineaceae bacterium]
MSGAFVTRAALETDQLDWGTLSWISRPNATGARQLTAIEVTLLPGKGHNFHKHPDQEEVIYVVEGTIEQWLAQERRQLSAGEAVFIPAGLVHASFNTGNTPAKLMVTLSPCMGEGGYELVDVADQAPWKDLR